MENPSNTNRRRIPRNNTRTNSRPIVSHCPASRGLGHWDSRDKTNETMSHYYSLQKYVDPATRYTCPNCGRLKCFTLYVDPEGIPIHKTVGRCDHESSCGYHLTPKQYFREHSHERTYCHSERNERLSIPNNRQDHHSLNLIPSNHLPSPSGDNYLITYLKTLIPTSFIDRVIIDYHIASTSDHATIFLQLDLNGNCRTGKIMQYDPATGHRIKDEAVPGRISWLHTRLKRRHQLPKDWQITQWLFGELLLQKYPDKTVALVESEKTAIICSALMPEYLWLATGGKSQFNQRLTVLKSRKIIAFPDIDGYHTWLNKSTDFPFLDLRVSDLLEKNATPADREAHIDLADWLLRYLQDTRR